MLTLNLKPIFQARGIQKPYTFLVKAGLSPASATNIINNKIRTFRLDHIELLCRILVCEPSDLLLFKPDKNQNYLPNHPLLKLQQQITDNNWQQTLANLPLKQLKEVTQNIIQNKENQQ